MNRGLSYGVRSRFATSASGGVFFVSTFTKVETTAEIVEVALRGDGALLRGGAGGSRSSSGRRATSAASSRSRSRRTTSSPRSSPISRCSISPTTRSGCSAIACATVGPEECRLAARRYFPLERRVVVAVGPAKTIAPSLERFGPVSVVPARKMA